MTQVAFHLKYRPQSLDDVLGHEQAVTRLRGMRKKDEFPNALLFCGPTSVGKTTLARALAADINGRPAAKQQDYMEINGTDQRSIDDIRNMVQISKFKPSSKKRIIVIDEAQGIVSNAPAAACFEAETMILTNKGEISARDLYLRMGAGEEFLAASYNHKTGHPEWKPIVGCNKKQSGSASSMIGEAGLTSDHLVYTAEEDKYVEAALCDGLTGIKLEIQGDLG